MPLLYLANLATTANVPLPLRTWNKRPSGENVLTPRSYSDLVKYMVKERGGSGCEGRREARQQVEQSSVLPWSRAPSAAAFFSRDVWPSFLESSRSSRKDRLSVACSSEGHIFDDLIFSRDRRPRLFQVQDKEALAPFTTHCRDIHLHCSMV